MFIYLMMIDSQEKQSIFEKIYFTYRGLMYHTAYKILNNEADAEDAVHNSFVKIAENISKIDVPVCPKTQLYVAIITKNSAIDLYRANQRKHNVKYIDEIADNSDEEINVHGLAACMEKLSQRYREIILLKYYYGFSCKEIAKQLNITEANAIKLDQRAKNSLLKICQEEGML